MKKTNIILGIALLAGACTFTACDSQLSALPTQYKVDGNVVVDQKSALNLLNGMYYIYAQAGRDNYDQMSSQCPGVYSIYPADFAGLYCYYQGEYMFEVHGGQGVTRYNSYLWDGICNTINAANSVIEQVGQAQDKWFTNGKKEEILGEAYGMRALAFYDMLRIFGYSWDVSSPYGDILRTLPSKVSNMAWERSSVKDTYTQILADVDYAIANAPSTNKSYYISKWFAKGLKARVLMLRGAEGDYAEAAELAKDVIDNSPYQLQDNVTDIFLKNGVEDPEVIFGIKPYDNQTSVYEGYVYYDEAQWIPTANFLALFDNDPRKDKTFVEQDDSEEDEYADDDEEQETTYRITKFVDMQKDEANVIEESQYNMRLTEMYLLRAEALVRSNGDMNEAKSLLKTVLSHAGYTDFSMVDNANGKEELLQQIFNEDLRNLFGEGGRELDFMLRFGSIATSFNSQYENQQLNVFPIPSDEFKYNSKLPKDMQNPGFSAD